jgi:putative transposase
MYEKVRKDVREILRTLCGYQKVQITEGAVCSDHVHLCLNIPPKISVSGFMGYLKGKSALMIFDKHPEMGSKFNRHFWARGYYVSTIGNINEEAIKTYIKNQQELLLSRDIGREASKNNVPNIITAFTSGTSEGTNFTIV